MRIELTIKTTYLPTWGIWEGIRELVQNAKDSETEHGAKMTVRHRRDSDTLVIENEGTTLPHEALLLGHTTKADRDDTIGKFGEGLKLGVLALLRKGMPVKIRSGSEVWVPEIAHSERFHADVLVFDIATGRKDENRIQIEIGGVSAEAWGALRSRFLFLSPPAEADSVRTSSGTLLLGSENIGKVFVKGILVNAVTGMNYGYDLDNAEVDRDRKMVASYDLRWQTGRIWAEASNARPDMLRRFLALLEGQAEDLSGLSAYNVANIPPEVRTQVVASFRARHGENALPVATLADSADVEHLGLVGVVCAKGLMAVLEAELGNLEASKRKVCEQVTARFGWQDLTPVERSNLRTSIALVNAQHAITLDEIDVCTFREARFHGFWRGGRVELSRSVLADTRQVLEVLVHEVAHKAGGNDGDKSHVSNIERIWSGIASTLLAGNPTA